jgi:hypothetical protein
MQSHNDAASRGLALSPAELGWDRKPQSLLFRLSYFLLCSARFKGYVATRSWHDMDDVTLDPEPYGELLPADCDAMVIRAFPIGDRNLPILASSTKVLRYAPFRTQRSFLDLTGAFEEYKQEYPRQGRPKLHQHLRRFARESEGTIDFRVYKTPDEIREFHRLAIEVSLRTYQEQLFHEGLDRTPKFGEQLIELAKVDAVRGYLLFLKGKPIAYSYCWAPPPSSTLIYQTTGYAPEFSKWSPGSMLLYLFIENLFTERRFLILDFGEGDHPYKRMFAPEAAECLCIYFFRKTARWRSVILLHRSFNGFTERVSRGFERLGWKEWIKRKIRTKSGQ